MVVPGSPPLTRQPKGETTTANLLKVLKRRNRLLDVWAEGKKQEVVEEIVAIEDRTELAVVAIEMFSKMEADREWGTAMAFHTEFIERYKAQ